MSKVWKWRLGMVVLIASGLSVFVDACFVEPNSIEVTRHTIVAPLSSPLRIAHLTDIHTSGLGRRELRMLQILDAEQPDLIVITGDSINVSSDYSGLRDVLSRMRAPLGVWVVRGNHEDWWQIANEMEFYESAGAKLLLNASREVRDGVWLVGFDDLYAGAPDAKKAFAGVPGSAYKLALFHSPMYFERIAGQADVALAGHTHGGQIRLPFIAPFWLPAYSGRYMEGWFEKEGTRMYVSRGVGTSIIDARFWCRPEIAIITIAPQH